MRLRDFVFWPRPPTDPDVRQYVDALEKILQELVTETRQELDDIITRLKSGGL